MELDAKEGNTNGFLTYIYNFSYLAIFSVILEWHFCSRATEKPL